MTTITLKNIPSFLHRRLKQQAMLHHRSLNSEILAFLESIVSSVPIDPDLLVVRARSLRHRVSGRLTERELHRLKNKGRP